MEQLDEILNVRGASQVLYETEDKTAAIYTKVHRRQIPFRKVNGQLRFLKSELIEHIKQSPGLTLAELQKKQ
jgi:hypothetical protein